MFINEVHIDNFGIFRNKHIVGFKRGLNLIYGPNEYGKTTFLEFIRRMLFGFPGARSKVNRYIIKEGESIGGRLSLKSDDGKEITIERNRAGRESLRLYIDGSELSGDDKIKQLTGITENLYKNIYAIGLDELRDAGKLQDKEIRNDIYGPGLGLGNVSLTKIKDELNDNVERIFNPKARKRDFNKLLKEIKEIEDEIKRAEDEISQYDSLIDERQKAEGKIKELKQKENELNQKLESLIIKDELYPKYIELKETKNELEQMEDLSTFPEDALQTYQISKDKLDDIRSRLKDKEAGYNSSLIEKKHLEKSFNPKVLDRENEISALIEKSELYKSNIDETKKLKDDIKALKKKIEDEKVRVDLDWSEEEFKKFKLSDTLKETIDSYEKRIEEAEGSISESKNKLDLYLEEKQRSKPPEVKTAVFIKISISTLTILGLVILLWGIFQSEIITAIIGGMVSLLGTVSIIKIIRKPRYFESIDEQGDFHKGKYDQALKELNNIKNDWDEFLAEINLNGDYAPKKILKLIKRIESIQSLIQERETKISKLNELDGFIEDVQQRYGAIIKSIKEIKFPDDISVGIKKLSELLQQTKSTQSELVHIKTDIEKAEQEIDSLKQEITEKEAEINKLLKSAGVNDYNQLKQKDKSFQKREKLEDEIRKIKLFIKAKVGDEEYDKLIEELSNAKPDEIREEISRLEDKINDIESESEELLKKTGELNIKINNLISQKDYELNLCKLETKKEELYNLTRQWLKYEIAVKMLDNAIAKYENTRQPAVIKNAKEIFAHITDNRYVNIVKPIDVNDNEFYIIGKTGERKSGIQMSQGTKEQLYLAMRLGLIEEYEQGGAEQMPVLMDDIFVNFDDKRKSETINTIKAFSAKRQLIILTCHRETAELFGDIPQIDITATND